MELSPWTLYWITRLDSVSVAIDTAAIVAFLGFGLSTITLLASEAHNEAEAFRVGKIMMIVTLPVFLVSATLAVLIPTTKEACAILVIPAVVNNEDVQEFGGEFVELAREWMRELRPAQEGDQ